MLMPEGFHYWPELVSRPEEASLLEAVSRLEFKPFEFKGFFGNRRPRGSDAAPDNEKQDRPPERHQRSR